MVRPARAILALTTLAALGAVGWLVYERTKALDAAAPPLIRADAGPMKIRPEDPGGMAVPDQDKLIYQALDGGVVEETVERLLPAPEEPLPPPEPPEPPPPAAPEVVVEPPPAAAAPTVQDSAMPPLPPAEIDAQAEVPAEVPAEVTPPPPPQPEPAPTPEPAPPAADPGVYMVQLASFRSIDAADRAWRRAVKKNGDLLSAHSARVVRADLGADKGIYFRLRVGPFAKGEEAKSLCAKLKARDVDCLVVRR